MPSAFLADSRLSYVNVAIDVNRRYEDVIDANLKSRSNIITWKILIRHSVKAKTLLLFSMHRTQRWGHGLVLQLLRHSQRRAKAESVPVDLPWVNEPQTHLLRYFYYSFIQMHLLKILLFSSCTSGWRYDIYEYTRCLATISVDVDVTLCVPIEYWIN